MRKGSSELGSLGALPRAALAGFGVALLILPLYAAASALLAPRAGWAQEQEAAAPAALDSASVRDAVERRSKSWLDQANELASRRRHAASSRKPAAAKQKVLKVIQTRATWYGPGFHGKRTASGERFNQNAMTLASRHLPFGTRVRVVNPRTGRSAIARVNDRGPFRSGYTADLSKGLAFKIGMRSSGPVRLEILPKQ
jgi:rare lipoprotein A (peptidoglycan hydrolase)